MGKYGYFSEDGKEFIITRPDTPQPWLNYSINGRYHALITNTGGGYSYFISPLNGRITRRRYNSLPEDRPGRYLYIRDNKTAEYYSPTWQPTLPDLEDYECRHGRGYSKISSQYKGLKHNVTIFVPKNEEGYVPNDSDLNEAKINDVEIWKYEIENVGGDRELSLFPYVEWVPGDASHDLVDQPNNAHFKEAHFNKAANAVVAENKIGISYRDTDEEQDKDDGCWGKVAYMSVAGLNIDGWDTNREKFMGSNYRSEQNPKTIEDGNLTNSDCLSGHFCGAIQSNITLKAGEKLEFCVIVGVADRLDKAYEKQIVEVMKNWSDMKAVDAAFEKVTGYYDKIHSMIQVETPEPKMNRHINTWNKIQLETTFRCGRDASRYHLGLSYGVGYRDAAQDLLGFIPFEASGSRDMILELFAHMFNNGYVYHHFFRKQKDGHVFTNHSDDPLWMAISLAYYLRETADYSVLEEVVPYRLPAEVPTKVVDGQLMNNNDWIHSVLPNWEKQRSEKETEGTALEHLFVGMDKTWDCRSDRDIPLMLGGDWNDDLNECGIQGKGESMMVAQQLAVAINYTVEMFENAPEGSLITKYADKIEEYKKILETLKHALNEHCWDGKWYHRFTRDNGQPEGTSKNEQGAIYLNSQTWAVIGETADDTRARQALDSVLKPWNDGGLDTPWGPVICSPVYTKSDASVGAATREAPGKKENASIFNHPVTWFIQANSILGRGNIAYQQYFKTMPENLSQDQDHFVVEPYVYPEYTTGPAHPDEGGRAGHSWLTGTAPWMFYSGVQFILGVKPEYNGLVIKPAIPSDWPGYKIKRDYQGATYIFNVLNPEGVESGVKSVVVDGKAIEGNKIPSFKDGKEHHIEVTLGK